MLFGIPAYKVMGRSPVIHPMRDLEWCFDTLAMHGNYETGAR
jgi:hypothetical protein